MKRFLLGVLLVTLLLACGKRWYPADPRVVHLGGPQLAHDATLATLRGEGYLIAQHDPARGLLVAKSKVDQKDASYRSRFGDGDKRVSWIAFQAYRDGSLHITAWGYHVKQDEGVMHRKLAREIDELLRHIHYHAKAMYQAQFGPPAPPPR